MRTFILVLHLMLTFSMIVVILFQRSEGGGLGLGGSTMGGMMSARGTANLLTRVTGILAALFIATNLLLAILARYETQKIVVPDAQKQVQPQAAPPIKPIKPISLPAAKPQMPQPSK